MEKLKDKVAVVTGGTSGIGAASAALMAQEGARVVIIGRDEHRGMTVSKKLMDHGLPVAVFRGDVSTIEDIHSLRAFIDKKYGRLDILMNNAGILLTGSLEELTDQEWDRTFDTNVKATMHMCKVFIDLLKISHGVILNNASNIGLSSYIQGRKSYMYASSKAAMIQFSQHLAKNYAPDVRVNVICPGVTMTNIFINRDFSRFNNVNLLGRVVKPEEIANAVLFLVSDDSSFMTGSSLVVDGGESIK